jgi:hypothetical protein
VRVIPEVILDEDLDPDSFLWHQYDYNMRRRRASKRASMLVLSLKFARGVGKWLFNRYAPGASGSDRGPSPHCFEVPGL